MQIDAAPGINSTSPHHHLLTQNLDNYCYYYLLKAYSTVNHTGLPQGFRLLAPLTVWSGVLIPD